jgi:dCTP deaminase
MTASADGARDWPEGILSARQIGALADGGALVAPPLDEGQVQPASLDLRLGAEAVRVRASFLPGGAATVAERLPELEMHRFPLHDGAVLEKGCVYLVPLQEGLALPEGIEAAANAKSSTGRLDLLTRTVTDRGTAFDRVEAGYRGPLWAEICPRSFSVLVRTGLRLNQIRFRKGHATLDDGALRALHRETPLVDGTAHVDGGLAFSVDLSGGGVVGWRAKPHTGVIDLARVGHYPPTDFWEPLHAPDRRIVLDPGAFYILVSREAVTIPPGHAAEMAPFLAMAGEFRVHYAGFFDPGFGWGTPARGVLEVRAHEAPFVLEHGQTVGRLVFERMSEVPGSLYGKCIASNYQGQGLKLSKHFRAG